MEAAKEKGGHGLKTKKIDERRGWCACIYPWCAWWIWLAIYDVDVHNAF
jgi:hypothetical protein